MFPLFVTDLDGTLLDQRTYEYAPALPALRKLGEKKMPLILCSSKTAAEMIPLYRELQIDHPFVVENGGGIYIPKSYFSTLPEGSEERGKFVVVALGSSYTALQQALEHIAVESRIVVRSFQEMSPEELSQETGLSLQEARNSLRRDFDLPFRILTPYDEESLQQTARRRSLYLTRGGRYFHLSGENDKGQAVKRLIELYRLNRGENILTIGLGDSDNDLAMLEAVDIPVIIPNLDSQAPLNQKLQRARTTARPGPAGWNEVVLSLLDEIEHLGGPA